MTATRLMVQEEEEKLDCFTALSYEQHGAPHPPLTTNIRELKDLFPHFFLVSDTKSLMMFNVSNLQNCVRCW